MAAIAPEPRQFVSLPPMAGLGPQKLRHTSQKDQLISAVVQEAIKCAKEKSPLAFHSEDLRALRHLFYAPHKGHFSWLKNIGTWVYLHIWKKSLVQDLEKAIRKSERREQRIGERIAQATKEPISEKEKAQRVRTFTNIVGHLLRPKITNGTKKPTTESPHKLLEKVASLSQKKVSYAAYSGVIDELFTKASKYQEFVQEIPELIAIASFPKLGPTSAKPPTTTIEGFCTTKVEEINGEMIRECNQSIHNLLAKETPDVGELCKAAAALNKIRPQLKTTLAEVKSGKHTETPRGLDKKNLRNLLKGINILSAKALLLSRIGVRKDLDKALCPPSFTATKPTPPADKEKEEQVEKEKPVALFIPDLGIPPQTSPSFCCVHSEKKGVSLQMDVPWAKQPDGSYERAAVHLEKNRILPTKEDAVTKENSASAILTTMYYLVQQNSIQEALKFVRFLASRRTKEGTEKQGLEVLFTQLKEFKPPSTESTLLALKIAIEYAQITREDITITKGKIANLYNLHEAVQLLEPRERYLLLGHLPKEAPAPNAEQKTPPITVTKKEAETPAKLSREQQKVLDEFSNIFPKPPTSGSPEAKERVTKAYEDIIETAQSLLSKPAKPGIPIPTQYVAAFEATKKMTYKVGGSKQIQEIEKQLVAQQEETELRAQEARSNLYACMLTLPARPRLFSIEELIICAAQDRLESFLELHGVQEYTTEVNEAIDQYLDAMQLFQQARRAAKACTELKEVKKEEDFGPKLENLQKQIQQQPSPKEMKFKVFEVFLDVIIREEQLSNLAALQNPSKSAAVQMLMGQGKTFILLPLLALLRADGQHLSTVMLPEALVEQVKTQLRMVLGDGFDQLVTELPISRGRDFSYEDLVHMESLIRETKVGRGCLLLSPDKKHVLINTFSSYLEQRKENPSPELDSKLACLARILSEFKKSESVIGDEIDDLLKSNLQYIIALGDAIPFNESEGTIISDITLAAIKEARDQKVQLDAFKPDPSKTPFTKELYFEKLLPNLVNTSLLLLEKTDDQKLHTFITTNKKAIETYLKTRERSDETSQKETFDAESTAEEIVRTSGFQNLLAGVRFTLQNILPQALDSHVNQDFGVADSQTSLIAVPFSGPGCITDTQFSNPYDQIVRTILSYIKLGPPKAAIDKLLQDPNKILQNTFASKLSSGQSLDATTLKAWIMNESNTADLRTFLCCAVLPKVETHEEHIASTPPKLVKSSSSFSGMTGTFWNISSMKFEEKKPDIETEVRVMMRLLEKEKKGEVTVKEVTNTSVDALAGLMKDHLALIDSGGWLRNTDKDVPDLAKTLLKKRKDVDGIVYHNEKGEPVMLTRAFPDPVPFDKDKSTVPYERRITIYAKQYTTGTDIPQADNAKALMTAGKQMILRDFQQSIYRMRKIEARQNCTIAVDPEMIASMKVALGTKPTEGPKLSLSTIFRYFITNQTERRLDDSYQAASQRVRATLEGVLREAVLSVLSKDVPSKDDLDTASQIFELGRNLFITQEGSAAWNKYGKIPKRIKKDQKIDRDKKSYSATLDQLSENAFVQKALGEKTENEAKTALQKAIEDCYSGIDLDDTFLDDDLRVEAGGAVVVESVVSATTPQVLITQDKVKETLQKVQSTLAECKGLGVTTEDFATKVQQALGSEKDKIGQEAQEILKTLETHDIPQPVIDTCFVQSQNLVREAKAVKENYEAYDGFVTAETKAQAAIKNAKACLEELRKHTPADQSAKSEQMIELDTQTTQLAKILDELKQSPSNVSMQQTATNLNKVTDLIQTSWQSLRDYLDILNHSIAGLGHLPGLQAAYNAKIVSLPTNERDDYATKHQKELHDAEKRIADAKSSVITVTKSLEDELASSKWKVAELAADLKTQTDHFQKALQDLKECNDVSKLPDLLTALDTVQKEVLVEVEKQKSLIQQKLSTEKSLAETNDLLEFAWARTRLEELKAVFATAHESQSFVQIGKDLQVLRKTVAGFGNLHLLNAKLKSNIEQARQFLKQPQIEVLQQKLNEFERTITINDQKVSEDDLRERMEACSELLDALFNFNSNFEKASKVLGLVQSSQKELQQKLPKGYNDLFSGHEEAKTLTSSLTAESNIYAFTQALNKKAEFFARQADMVSKKLQKVTTTNIRTLRKRLDDLELDLKKCANTLSVDIKGTIDEITKARTIETGTNPAPFVQASSACIVKAETALKRLQEQLEQRRVGLAAQIGQIRQICSMCQPFTSAEQDPAIEALRIALNARRNPLDATVKDMEAKLNEQKLTDGEKQAAETFAMANQLASDFELYKRLKEDIVAARKTTGKSTEFLERFTQQLTYQEKEVQQEQLQKYKTAITTLEQLLKTTKDVQDLSHLQEFLKKAWSQAESLHRELTSYLDDRLDVHQHLLLQNLTYTKGLQTDFNARVNTSSREERSFLDQDKMKILECEKAAKRLQENFSTALTHLQLPSDAAGLLKYADDVKGEFQSIMEKLQKASTHAEFADIFASALRAFKTFSNIHLASQKHSALLIEVQKISLKYDSTDTRIQAFASDCKTALSEATPRTLDRAEKMVEYLKRLEPQYRKVKAAVLSLKTDIHTASIQDAIKNYLTKAIQNIERQLPIQGIDLSSIMERQKSCALLLRSMLELENQNTEVAQAWDQGTYIIAPEGDAELQRLHKKQDENDKEFDEACKELLTPPDNVSLREIDQFTQDINRLTGSLRRATQHYQETDSRIFKEACQYQRNCLKHLYEKIIADKALISDDLSSLPAPLLLRIEDGDKALSNISKTMDLQDDRALNAAFTISYEAATKFVHSLEEGVTRKREISTLRKALNIEKGLKYLDRVRQDHNKSVNKMNATDSTKFAKQKEAIESLDMRSCGLAERLQGYKEWFSSNYESCSEFGKFFLKTSGLRDRQEAVVKKVDDAIEMITQATSLQDAEAAYQKAMEKLTLAEDEISQIVSGIKSLPPIEKAAKKEKITLEEFNNTSETLLAFCPFADLSTIVQDTLVGPNINKFLLNGIYAFGLTPLATKLATALSKPKDTTLLLACVNENSRRLTDRFEKETELKQKELLQIATATPEEAQSAIQKMQVEMIERARFFEKEFLASVPQGTLEERDLQQLHTLFNGNLSDITQERAANAFLAITGRAVEHAKKSDSSDELKIFSSFLDKFLTIFEERRAAASAQKFGRTELACSEVIKNLERFKVVVQKSQTEVEKRSNFYIVKSFLSPLFTKSILPALAGVVLTPIVPQAAAFFLPMAVSNAAAILTNPIVKKAVNSSPKWLQPTLEVGLQAGFYMASSAVYMNCLHDRVIGGIQVITEKVRNSLSPPTSPPSHGNIAQPLSKMKQQDISQKVEQQTPMEQQQTSQVNSGLVSEGLAPHKGVDSSPTTIHPTQPFPPTQKAPMKRARQPSKVASAEPLILETPQVIQEFKPPSKTTRSAIDQPLTSTTTSSTPISQPTVQLQTEALPGGGVHLEHTPRVDQQLSTATKTTVVGDNIFNTSTVGTHTSSNTGGTRRR